MQDLQAGAYLGGSRLETAKRKLLEKGPIRERVLRGLAQARGESIRDYLTNEQGLADQRIYLLDVKLGKSQAKGIKAMQSLGWP